MVGTLRGVASDLSKVIADATYARLDGTNQPFTGSIEAPDLTTDYVTFDTTPTIPAYAEGQVYWNTDDHCLNVTTDTPDVLLQVGQETIIHAKNTSGGTITDGQVVYINGAVGASGFPTIDLAQADDFDTSRQIGVATNTMANNAFGWVTLTGKVRGVNTSAFTQGDLLYLSATVAGGLTATPPVFPNYRAPVAIVIDSHTINGTLLVFRDSPTFGAMTQGDVLFAGADGMPSQDLTFTYDATTDTLNAKHLITQAVTLNTENVLTGKNIAGTDTFNVTGAGVATAAAYRTLSNFFDVGFNNTLGTGSNRIIFGANNTTNTDNEYIAGTGNTVTGSGAYAIGINNTADGSNAAATGTSNLSYGTNASAVGFGCHAGTAGASTLLSFASGVSAKAYQNTAAAIGTVVTANAANSLTLSGGSVNNVNFIPSTAQIYNGVYISSIGVSGGVNSNPLERLHSTGNVLATNVTSLGAEKVTNGTFTGSAASWTLGADWVYGTNNVQKTGAGTTTLVQTIANMVSPPVVGEYYLVVIPTSAFNAAAVGQVAQFTFSYAGFTFSNITGAPNGITQGASGSITFIMRATNTTGDLTFTPTANCRVTLDNISIKRILGGDIKALGGLQLATGNTNSTAGTGTLSAGTVTINTTAVTANSMIHVTSTNNSTVNVGTLTAPLSGITAGTSFTVTSTNVLDTSTFNWFIINPL